MTRLVYVWVFVLSLLAGLQVSACTRAPLRSPLVQVAEWPNMQAHPEPAHCSGFAVLTREGVFVLTAAHCVPHEVGARMPLVTLERWRYTARGVRWATVLVVDRVKDVAVLQPDEAALAELDAMPLAGRLPAPGEPVTLRSGRFWAEARGHVQGPYYADYEDHAVECWSASTTVSPGWSGSAVVDQQGRVIGVVVACQYQRASDGSKGCKPGLTEFQAVTE